MSSQNQPGFWKEKFKELTKTILTPNKGPYAGRTTIFMGAVIAFFCGVNILVGLKQNTEINVLNYILFVIGLIDIILGIKELRVQKEYERDQEQHKEVS